MAIKTTRWTPDTCADPPCIVDYTWDDTVPQDSRTHTVSAVVQRCVLHAPIATATAHFAALQDENPRKNKLIALLVAQFPTAVRTNAAGDFLGFNVAVHRFFSTSRVLILAIPSLTALQISSLQTLIDTTFGAGKIRVLSGIALQLLAELISRFPALARLGSDGLDNFRDLVEWSVSGGVITLTIPILTAAQKTALQTWCDTNLGAEKVVVA